jgi:hypothetical protein
LRSDAEVRWVPRREQSAAGPDVEEVEVSCAAIGAIGSVKLLLLELGVLETVEGAIDPRPVDDYGALFLYPVVVDTKQLPDKCTTRNDCFEGHLDGAFEVLSGKRKRELGIYEIRRRKCDLVEATNTYIEQLASTVRQTCADMPVGPWLGINRQDPPTAGQQRTCIRSSTTSEVDRLSASSSVAIDELHGGVKILQRTPACGCGCECCPLTIFGIGGATKFEFTVHGRTLVASLLSGWRIVRILG